MFNCKKHEINVQIHIINVNLKLRRIKLLKYKPKKFDYWLLLHKTEKTHVEKLFTKCNKKGQTEIIWIILL